MACRIIDLSQISARSKTCCTYLLWNLETHQVHIIESPMMKNPLYSGQENTADCTFPATSQGSSRSESSSRGIRGSRGPSCDRDIRLILALSVLVALKIPKARSWLVEGGRRRRRRRRRKFSSLRLKMEFAYRYARPAPQGKEQGS